MKNKFLFMSVFATAAIFAVVFSGCPANKGSSSASNSSSVNGAKTLVGTWESDFGYTWSFTKDKFTQEMMGIKTTVPYKIKDNAIITKYEDMEVEMEFEIDGDTLTVDIMGFELEFERVK